MSEIQAEASSELGLNWVRTSTDKPETIVFVHAVGYDLTYWDRQIEALRGNYNVVAFDLPGHGRSSGIAEDYSFDDAAIAIAKLIEAVSTKPVHLVGISFGSFIEQVMTLARPDLVRSLTLIGAASHFPEEVQKGMKFRAKTVRSGGMSAVLESSLERWFTPNTRTQRPDIIDRVTKTILGDDPVAHAAIWDLISTFDVQGRLGEIRCPTLILVGEHDPSTPQSVAYGLAEAIRGAKIAVIQDASHIVTVEAPAAVNDALRGFLNELADRPS